MALKNVQEQLQQKLDMILEENKKLKTKEEENQLLIARLELNQSAIIPEEEFSIQDLVESPIKMKGSSLFEELEEHVATKVREELKEFENVI